MREDIVEQPQLFGFPEADRLEYLRLFELVRSKNNWRNPISTTVKLSEDEIPKMKEAIRLITGSREIQIKPSNHFEGEYSINAEGHYNAAT